MCNACGFLCCAYDGFSGCGCEWCSEPACWPDDLDDEEPDDDEIYGPDYDACACRRPTAFICDTPAGRRALEEGTGG